MTVASQRGMSITVASQRVQVVMSLLRIKAEALPPSPKESANALFSARRRARILWPPRRLPYLLFLLVITLAALCLINPQKALAADFNQPLTIDGWRLKADGSLDCNWGNQGIDSYGTIFYHAQTNAGKGNVKVRFNGTGPDNRRFYLAIIVDDFDDHGTGRGEMWWRLNNGQLDFRIKGIQTIRLTYIFMVDGTSADYPMAASMVYGDIDWQQTVQVTALSATTINSRDIYPGSSWLAPINNGYQGSAGEFLDSAAYRSGRIFDASMIVDFNGPRLNVVFGCTYSTTSETQFFTDPTAWPVFDPAYVQFTKASTRPELTDGNPAYSLNGCVVYLKNPIGTISVMYGNRTGSGGPAKTSLLELEQEGTWYYQERVAPQGFILDDSWHAFNVESGQTYHFVILDEPVTKRVDYFVDGDLVYSDNDVPLGIIYDCSTEGYRQASALATKQSCTPGWNGIWYLAGPPDASDYSQEFTSLTISSNVKLYAFNEVTVSYAFGQGALARLSDVELHTSEEESQSNRIEAQSLLPASEIRRYGSTFNLSGVPGGIDEVYFWQPESYQKPGKWRKCTCTDGWYLSSACTGYARDSLIGCKEDTVVYARWKVSVGWGVITWLP